MEVLVLREPLVSKLGKGSVVEASMKTSPSVTVMKNDTSSIPSVEVNANR